MQNKKKKIQVNIDIFKFIENKKSLKVIVSGNLKIFKNAAISGILLIRRTADIAIYLIHLMCIFGMKKM